MKNKYYKAELLERFLTKREQADLDQRYEEANLRNIARHVAELAKMEEDDRNAFLSWIKKTKKEIRK